MSFLHDRLVQDVLNVLSILVGYQGFRNYLSIDTSGYLMRSGSALIWSLCLFTILLNGAENSIAKFFAHCSVLKSCGKFSFGIYLFTPGAIIFVKDNFTFKTQLEHVFWCIVCAYLCGFALFHLIENPLINVANRFCERLEASKFFRIDNDNKNFKKSIII